MRLTNTTLLFLATIAFFQLGCSQQPKCVLTLEQSPAIRCIRLGMTPAEINAVIPGLHLTEQTNPSFNEGSWSGGIENRNHGYPQLQGIKGIGLTFLDNRLYSMTVEYEDNGEFRRSEQFLEAITPQLGLPPRGWGKRAYEIEALECSGFILTAGVKPDLPTAVVDVSGRPRSIKLILTDKAAQSELFSRWREKKQKRRESFSHEKNGVCVQKAGRKGFKNQNLTMTERRLVADPLPQKTGQGVSPPHCITQML
jgi:hypothetical protein